MKIVASLLLLAGLTSACTTTSMGRPDADPDITRVDETVEERPREIKIDGVDPCSLIRTSDYPDFYLDEAGVEHQDKTFDAAECAWDGTDIGYFAVLLVTTGGVEMWLDGSTSAHGRAADPIDGFPVVTVLRPEDENSCFAAVDVADGQQLLAQVGIDNSKLSSVPPVCDVAHRFASSAMSTLVASS